MDHEHRYLTDRTIDSGRRFSGHPAADVAGRRDDPGPAVGKGKVSGASGGYILPSGANRAPDDSWISPEQLAAITANAVSRSLTRLRNV
jgi:hypothetical protein